MEGEREIKELVGSKIYVELISGSKYSGVIKSVFLGHVHIIDRYNNFVMFSIDEIKLLEVKGNERADIKKS